MTQKLWQSDTDRVTELLERSIAVFKRPSRAVVGTSVPVSISQSLDWLDELTLDFRIEDGLVRLAVSHADTAGIVDGGKAEMLMEKMGRITARNTPSERGVFRVRVVI